MDPPTSAIAVPESGHPLWQATCLALPSLAVSDEPDRHVTEIHPVQQSDVHTLVVALGVLAGIARPSAPAQSTVVLFILVAKAAAVTAEGWRR